MAAADGIDPSLVLGRRFLVSLPDLRISVTKEKSEEPGIICVVNRNTMVAASPMFRAMFDAQSRWAESSIEGERAGALPTISVHEDYPSAFKLVVDNIHRDHGASAWRPQSPDLLVEVASIVDKYDLTAYINRFDVAENIDEASILPHQVPDDPESRMWVGFVLGWRELLEDAGASILKNLSFDFDGTPKFRTRLLDLDLLSDPCYGK